MGFGPESYVNILGNLGKALMSIINVRARYVLFLKGNGFQYVAFWVFNLIVAFRFRSDPWVILRWRRDLFLFFLKQVDVWISFLLRNHHAFVLAPVPYLTVFGGVSGANPSLLLDHVKVSLLAAIFDHKRVPDFVVVVHPWVAVLKLSGTTRMCQVRSDFWVLFQCWV